MQRMQTLTVAERYDVLAPDSSEIRLLVSTDRGSMVHCTLKPGQITKAVKHRTVDEAWFCISGNGRLWRSRDEGQETIDLTPGTGAGIAAGTRFQFRNDGDAPLEIVIATFPPWPSETEAIECEGAWEPNV